MTTSSRLAVDIYVKHGGVLSQEQRMAYERVGARPTGSPDLAARAEMCGLVYDVRMFGAVMTTGKSGSKGSH